MESDDPLSGGRPMANTSNTINCNKTLSHFLVVLIWPDEEEKAKRLRETLGSNSHNNQLHRGLSHTPFRGFLLVLAGFHGQEECNRWGGIIIGDNWDNVIDSVHIFDSDFRCVETLTGTEWPIHLSEFSQLDMEQIDRENEAGAASDLEGMNQMMDNLKLSTCRILTTVDEPWSMMLAY